MLIVKKFLRYVTGIGLVILGIIGLILPIMPGWVFLVPGLMILGDEIPWLDRFLKRWMAYAKEKLRQERPAPKNERTDSPPPAV